MSFEEIPGGCDVPNPEAVVALIERFGIHGLGGCDGCACADFKLLAIDVSVSCHKSSHCVRVASHYLGCDHRSLFPVAHAVLRQLPDGGARYTVRFCEYADDHGGHQWDGKAKAWTYISGPRCCFCGTTREGVGYLCERCERNPDALQSYPLDLLRFDESRPVQASERR